MRAASSRVRRAIGHAMCALALAMCACVLYVACGGEHAADDGAAATRLVLAVPAGIDPAEIVLAPAAAIASREVRAAELVVQLRRGAQGPLVARHPELCASPIDLAVASPRPPPGAPLERVVPLRALFELGDDVAQVGFGHELRIEVRPGCREAMAGRIVWEQLAGAPLAARTEARNGFVFSARMPSALELLGAEPTWGVVPISPRTRGEVELRATLRSAGRADVARTFRAAVIARSSGMPSVGLGTQLVLGGSGWRVRQRPATSRAEPRPLDGVRAALLELDAKGRFELEDETGRTLVLRAGSHGETPLDCGRAECHASAADHAARSPMTSILARALDGALGAAHDPRCALGCHAVGEPGIADGGFAHVARELGYALPTRGASGGWAATPRPLRRLGGVGCTACHGPGAIPEEGARDAILASSVCAICHDAPPRYRHVEALARTAMARADADPATRTDPVCARCHTTSAFVGRGLPRADAPTIGIACAACHAAHGEAGTSLLRVIAAPESLGARGRDLARGTSATCLACHAPVDGAGTPYASSALLLLGAASATPDPHITERGCLVCHGSAGGRGASHDFAVSAERCAPCHDDAAASLVRGRALSAALTTRAGVLAARLGVVNAAGHASFVLASDARDEARRSVAIVLEDRAAGVHGAAHARALLDAAESAMSP